MKPYLLVLSTDFRGFKFNLDGETTTCGRDKGNSIRLADKTVSSQHCLFHYDEETGIASLEDLGSKNGVFVNNIRRFGKTEIKGGDVVQVGLIECMMVDAENSDFDTATRGTCPDIDSTVGSINTVTLTNLSRLYEGGKKREKRTSLMLNGTLGVLGVAIVGVVGFLLFLIFK
jgi:FHA domain